MPSSFQHIANNLHSVLHFGFKMVTSLDVYSCGGSFAIMNPNDRDTPPPAPEWWNSDWQEAFESFLNHMKGAKGKGKAPEDAAGSAKMAKEVGEEVWPLQVAKVMEVVRKCGHCRWQRWWKWGRKCGHCRWQWWWVWGCGGGADPLCHACWACEGSVATSCSSSKSSSGAMHNCKGSTAWNSKRPSLHHKKFMVEKVEKVAVAAWPLQSLQLRRAKVAKVWSQCHWWFLVAPLQLLLAPSPCPCHQIRFKAGHLKIVIIFV